MVWEMTTTGGDCRTGRRCASRSIPLHDPSLHGRESRQQGTTTSPARRSALIMRPNSPSSCRSLAPHRCCRPRDHRRQRGRAHLLLHARPGPARYDQSHRAEQRHQPRGQRSAPAPQPHRHVREPQERYPSPCGRTRLCRATSGVTAVRWHWIGACSRILKTDPPDLHRALRVTREGLSARGTGAVDRSGTEPAWTPLVAVQLSSEVL